MSTLLASRYWEWAKPPGLLLVSSGTTGALDIINTIIKNLPCQGPTWRKGTKKEKKKKERDFMQTIGLQLCSHALDHTDWQMRIQNLTPPLAFVVDFFFVRAQWKHRETICWSSLSSYRCLDRNSPLHFGDPGLLFLRQWGYIELRLLHGDHQYKHKPNCPSLNIVLGSDNFGMGEKVCLQYVLKNNHKESVLS